MNVLAALLRGVVSAAAIFATPRLVGAVTHTGPQDPDIGAGLIAIGVVIVLSGAWALVDAMRHGFGWSLRTWALAAAIPALGLWLGHAITESDASMSVVDLLVSDALLVPMLYAFVITGALVGAGLGEAVRPLSRS